MERGGARTHVKEPGMTETSSTRSSNSVRMKSREPLSPNAPHSMSTMI